MGVSEIILYIFAFLALYVQIFFLLTFIERRNELGETPLPRVGKKLPGATIIVPCWNESTTLVKTTQSLLNLDYPKDKLKIILVDDGSTDDTWEVMQKYKDHPQIKIYHKENGGKHTAVNMGIEMTETELVGCLDADSFVHHLALKRIVTYFLKDKDTMAVAPSIVVHEPKNIVQKAQKAEYDMAVFVKKMLGFLGAIHVTPGPFSIFRKKVFDQIGPFRKAHNTEDQEIALRMHEHGLKIEQCPDAFVYTISPNTVKKLYKQRLRWIYGFINNMIDYRRLIFNPKHGNVSFFTLPSGLISLIALLALVAFLVIKWGMKLYEEINRFRVVGFSFAGVPKFDFFFFNTESVLFISIILYVIILSWTLIGRKMAHGKARVTIDLLYFVLVYNIVAPFWVLKAFWNTVFSKKPSWR